jgi:hypothetical protein
VLPPLLQAFPFPSTMWEVATHPPSLAGLFIYSSRGKCPFPLPSGVFLPLPLLQAFSLQGFWAGTVTPAFSGWLVYLQFCEGLPLPPFGTQGTPPSLLHVFFCCCCFSFFPGWGSVCTGGCAIWPRVVCGSIMYCLAHLVVCVSQAGRKWHLVAWEPSWFLRLPWSWDAMRRLVVWRNWSFVSSRWFFL